MDMTGRERHINPYFDFGFKKLFVQAEMARYDETGRRRRCPHPHREIMRLLTIILLLLAHSLQAQDVTNFTFRHLGQRDGLLSQRIYAVQQTADGALWWSTKYGVERYNGVSIRHYQPGDPTAYSEFAGKYVRLCTHTGKEDRLPNAADLLVYDNKGRIYTFDAVHDCFRLRTDISKQTGTDIDLNDLLPMGRDYWLATNKGIYWLHDGRLVSVRSGVHASYIIPARGSLLFCTRQGVLQYDGNAAPQAGMTLHALDTLDAESGYYDSINNKVWVGGYSTGVRILPFGQGNGAAVSISVASATALTHNPVRAICPYNEHTMLIGIDGLGVYKVNRTPKGDGHHEAMLLFNANEGRYGVLHGNGIYAVLRDVWGNIVVGSYSGGIDVARPVGTTIAMFRHEVGNQQSIQNDRVNCVQQIGAHTLMMGTDDGVSLYNLQSQTWRHTCRGAVVLDLCRSGQTVLAATYGKGVLELHADGSAHPLYNKANGVLDDDHVYRLYFDRDGSLWMGCLDGSLVQKSGATCRYYPIHYVKDLLQLPDGQMAVATSHGLYLIAPATGKTTVLDYQPDGEKDVNRYIHALYLDGASKLWIATDGGGLYIYNLQTRHCRHLTTADGLPSNFVNSICKDVKGRILLATERGLSYADPQHANRIVGVNYCYGVDREYTSRSAVNLANGHIMFGSTTGAIVVDPAHIQGIDYKATLRLTSISSDEASDSLAVERMHQMLARREVSLAYRLRTFQLSFESINLRNQADIGYQYRVDNGEWSTVTTQQYIRFTSMEPGRHRLLVRSVSRTCGAVLDEVALTIRIAQPWWNSWWMWLVYVALIALAFYGAWRIYQLHTKYMRLVVSNPNLAAGVPSAVSPDGLRYMTVGCRPDGTQQTEANGEASEGHDEDGGEFVSRATQLVVDNIADSSFTIDRLCREMAMSRTLFYVKLKSYTGKSPQDFIRIIRLERAAALLRSGRTVTDAAALSGFDNPKYFSTVFKKYFGMSPSKYR